MAADIEASDAEGLAPLVAQLRRLIADARQRALRAVDAVQVQTCWQVGRHIVEFEQQGQARAAYGKGLLSQLAGQLTAEFGKGLTSATCATCAHFSSAFRFGTQCVPN